MYGAHINCLNIWPLSPGMTFRPIKQITAKIITPGIITDNPPDNPLKSTLYFAYFPILILVRIYFKYPLLRSSK